MAHISRTQDVTDSEGGTWRVFGDVDTDNGTTYYIIYGSSGTTIVEGAYSKVSGLVGRLPVGPDNFVGHVLDTLSNMESGFNNDYPKPSNAGVKTLADLNDTKKMADPSATAGLNGDVSTVGNKMADLGSVGFSPDKLAGAFTSGAIKMPSLPHLDSFAGGLAAAVKNSAPTITGLVAGAEGVVGGLVKGVKGELSGLMGGIASAINSMTGVGGGTLGVPKLNDIMGPITGQSPAMRAAMMDPTSPEAVAAINTAVANANNFFATAGIDLNAPKPNGLKSCMNFATNLHGLGKDSGGFGTANMLGAMATADHTGDAIKASLQEGKNNAVLNDAAGVPPPVHDSPTTYTEDRARIDDKETKLLNSYEDSPLLSYKLHNAEQCQALRTQILDLDKQYANDASVVAGSQEVYDAYTSLIASLRRAIARGITSV